MQTKVRYSVTADGTIVQFEAQIAEESARLDPVFAQSVNPSDLVGRNLFTFIDGTEVCQLYSMLHERVLKAARHIAFDYRCDGPRIKREMRMSLAPDGKLVRYESVVLKETQRAAPIPNFYSTAQVFVVICSMCHQYRYPFHSPEWREIDLILSEPGLPERFRFTHGLCHRCFERCLDEVSR